MDELKSFRKAKNYIKIKQQNNRKVDVMIEDIANGVKSWGSIPGPVESDDVSSKLCCPDAKPPR